MLITSSANFFIYGESTDFHVPIPRLKDSANLTNEITLIFDKLDVAGHEHNNL